MWSRTASRPRRSCPPGWHAVASDPTHTGRLPQPYTTWTDQGRALAFPYRDGQAVWPLQRQPNRPGFEPVPGVEALLNPVWFCS